MVQDIKNIQMVISSARHHMYVQYSFEYQDHLIIFRRGTTDEVIVDGETVYENLDQCSEMDSVFDDLAFEYKRSLAAMRRETSELGKFLYPESSLILSNIMNSTMQSAA